MFKKSKLFGLVVLAASTSFVAGCFGAIHNLLIHASELTQWAAAFRILGSTRI